MYCYIVTYSSPVTIYALEDSYPAAWSSSDDDAKDNGNGPLPSSPSQRLSQFGIGTRQRMITG